MDNLVNLIKGFIYFILPHKFKFMLSNQVFGKRAEGSSEQSRKQTEVIWLMIKQEKNYKQYHFILKKEKSQKVTF